MVFIFSLILTSIFSLSGEATKLVIDNYLRSLTYGTKYVFQTLPKLLTLWLEHASIVEQPIDPKRGDNE
jgi:serine/threonine-protein kinase ATR